MKVPQLLRLACILVLGAGEAALGQGPQILSTDAGASIAFNPTNDGWTPGTLTIPGRLDPFVLTELDGSDTVGTNTITTAPSWTLVPQDDASRLIFEQAPADSGLVLRRIYSFGPATNVLRIETWARVTEGTGTLIQAGLLDLQIAKEGFRETGPAPASFPLFGHELFAGIEHVSGTARPDGEAVHLSQRPFLTLDTGWRFVAATVIGWVPATGDGLTTGDARVRGAFLQYLDTVRIKPADLELHTNTWWTLPLPFSETDVLNDIDALRRGFGDRTGMFFNSFALDLGWSDPHSIWKVDARRFPNEFRTITSRLAETGTGLGIWASPGSAYPEGLDNNWLASSGYEVTPFGNPNDALNKVACMALGNRYQREFKANLLQLVRTYNIRHVKLDFMAHSCDVAAHGHPTGGDSQFAIEAGLADVLDSLRAQNPNIILEPLVCGYPPSPWWLMHTQYLLGPDGDDVPYGRVPGTAWLESLITARDIAYRADQPKWIMPTQALETFDIVRQIPGDFQNLAVMAIGRGRWFISTYLKPSLMSGSDWDFLAAMVRWGRENKQYLGNARQIGGRPEDRDAYGYQFHNDAKDIFCVRNPWIEARTIDLPLPDNVTEARELRMIYPRRATLARIEPGTTVQQISVAPYETALLETVPAQDDTNITDQPAAPQAELTTDGPAAASSSELAATLQYSWSGHLNLPGGAGAEICLLIESPSAAVNGTNAQIYLNGRSLRLTKSSSVGQWGAAGSPSPENWTWFTAPLGADEVSFDIEADVPLDNARIGVFVRGTVPVTSDPAPDDVAAFPLYHPDQRAWSQTLAPMQSFSVDATVEEPAPAGFTRQME